MKEMMETNCVDKTVQKKACKIRAADQGHGHKSGQIKRCARDLKLMAREIGGKPGNDG